MNLYLVRHGETEWNRLKRFQGQQDSILTEIGIAQAENLGNYLEKENINFDFIYSSPLKRAYDTAKLIKNKFDIIEDERLMEMAFGTWEGMCIEDIKEESQENYYNFFNKTEDYDNMPHGAESFENLENRVKDFLEEIRTIHMGKNVLIVSHGITLKVFLKVIKNESLKEFSKSGGLFNTSLSLVTYDRKWSIEYLSKLEHLGDKLVTKWISE